MRNCVVFKSDTLRDTAPDDSHPDGEAVARFLASRLPDYGFRPGAVIMEDWGWVVAIKDIGFPAWIGCGSAEEDKTIHCFFIPKKPSPLHRLIRRDADTTTEKLVQALDAILRDSGQAQHIQWSEDAP